MNVIPVRPDSTLYIKGQVILQNKINHYYDTVINIYILE